MLNGTTNELINRVNMKVEQTKRSDDSGLEAYVVVVEFSTPQALMVQR